MAVAVMVEAFVEVIVTHIVECAVVAVEAIIHIDECAEGD